MNKQQISEMLAVFPMTESARKSVANRIESALSKNGTPAQLLSSASQSLRKRAEETPDTPDYGAIIGIATALDFAREIVNAGKEAKKSAKREYWAESQEEAQALKAKAEASKTAPKPSRKAKAEESSVTAKDLDTETLRALLEAMLSPRYTGR